MVGRPVPAVARQRLDDRVDDLDPGFPGGAEQPRLVRDDRLRQAAVKRPVLRTRHMRGVQPRFREDPLHVDDQERRLGAP